MTDAVGQARTIALSACGLERKVGLGFDAVDALGHYSLVILGDGEGLCCMGGSRPVLWLDRSPERSIVALSNLSRSFGSIFGYFCNASDML
ncbi:hypothetical protein AXG93_2035s1210 [Marchantia polymorpha subsp. ruderalis]|uniref:Uncharacterized protein n=1 Tax=Marchantia polymorpha subsp. ruderalis TaxID=1480154 RepID=A0A176VP99_MARPO|nr:hypothetical protein AXG93_2035s1210 [Marchantia polymorpha subsp. ruderalis]